MRKMCQRKGYDLDTAFKGLLDYLLWIFDPEGNKPDGWRFDHADAMMFRDMAQAYFQMIAEELKHSEWYDAFGDLYMALYPGGGGKAQFFTPPSVCQVTAECCMAGKDIASAEGSDTTFGKRVCINDPAAGSARLPRVFPHAASVPGQAARLCKGREKLSEHRRILRTQMPAAGNDPGGA